MTARTKAARKPAKKPQPEMPLPLLLTVPQACAVIGISKRRFYELRNQGLVRVVVLGPQSVRVHICDAQECAERLREVKTG